jgi:hypothetical protein
MIHGAERYRIAVNGRLPTGATAEFAGWAVTFDGETTTLAGVIADAAALYGVIARLEGLGVTLRSVQPERPPPTASHER